MAIWALHCDAPPLIFRKEKSGENIYEFRVAVVEIS
jgi:hypothetical protein